VGREIINDPLGQCGLRGLLRAIILPYLWGQAVNSKYNNKHTIRVAWAVEIINYLLGWGGLRRLLRIIILL
jgi:hypothetical protein